MLTNITLGQYYPVDSPIHRLDPRVKLLLTLALIVAVFLGIPYWKAHMSARKGGGRHA